MFTRLDILVIPRQEARHRSKAFRCEQGSRGPKQGFDCCCLCWKVKHRSAAFFADPCQFCAWGQPFCVKYRMGNLALAHNGNLSNAGELRQFFENQGVLMQSTVDSELFLHLVSHSKRSSQLDQIFDAMTQTEGAFSCIVLTDNCLVAVRDPNGFRPLCIGKLAKRGPGGVDGYCVASETCALDLCKAEYVRDVEPGEMIVIDMNTVNTGTFSSLRLPQKFGTSQCIFEYVYFARPDSRIFGEFVTKVRRELGRQLAQEHPVPLVRVRGSLRSSIVVTTPLPPPPPPPFEPQASPAATS